MTISLKLLDTNNQIQKEIYKQLAKELNKLVRKNNPKVTRTLRGYIENWVLESPEVSSLLAQGLKGSLNARFGLIPGSAVSAVNAIASSVANATQINVKEINRNLSGTIEFNFQSQDFANLLALPEGHQLSEEGIDLHWLDWLLTKGDSIIIQGYYYDPRGLGRSGGGTMSLGGTFRVPPEFSGTPDDNFITRVFRGKEKVLQNILSNLLS